jgi:hypothetical protein
MLPSDVAVDGDEDLGHQVAGWTDRTRVKPNWDADKHNISLRSLQCSPLIYACTP